MNTIKIKDFYGRVLGTIETDNQGNKVAKDFYGRVVGRYDAKSDITKDFYFRVVGRGDIVASLLPPFDQQK